MRLPSSFGVLGYLVAFLGVGIALADGYVNQRYGFTVNIPQGWTQQERPELQGESRDSPKTNTALVITELPQITQGAFNSNITVAVRDINKSNRLKNVKDIQGIAIEILNSIPLGNSPGPALAIDKGSFLGARRLFQYQQEYAGRVNKLAVEVTALISTKRDRCFLITGATLSENFSRYEPVFHSVVDSFEELGSTGTP